ncbi:hypothetical protein OEA41_003203 [Lepraria neglecta]|uniref:Rhodopsin domain-containing protein n=1 Tax=Lepraria neglecta TaxID=209136 RepID=A0AAD9Z3U9_9LECA|nr:hypothetical protein OEA41_003203 [Lepraria neglecta]
MTDSALTGTPPANQNDLYIVKGIYDRFGIPGDPSEGFAFPPDPLSNRSHANKGPGIIVGVAMAITVIAAVTGGRLYARYTHKASRLGWDDALIVVAVAAAISWLTLVIGMVTRGDSGQHIYNTTYDNLFWFFYLGSIDETLFFVTVGITKLSIIGFNWRLTGETSKAWQWTHRIFFVAIISYLITSLFWTNFRCNPPGTGQSLIVWGQNAGHVTCLNANTMGVTLSINWTPQLHWTIVDLVTSVCVTSLPALSSLLTKHLPQSVRNYWGKRDNVDEFGRPFNDGYFYEANQRSYGHALRHGGWGELFGKHDLDLEKYVTPDPSTPSRNLSTSQNTTVLAEQERVQKQEDNDYASFAKFIGRGELADQSYAPHSEVALTPDESHNGLDTSVRSRAPPIKFVEPSGHLTVPEKTHTR